MVPPHTDVLEIEDVQGRKRVAPPPTDQTHGPKWSIFWRGTTRGIQLRGTEAILEFRPMSGDTGVLYQNLGLFSDPYVEPILLLKSTVSQLMDGNSKIASVPLN